MADKIVNFKFADTLEGKTVTEDDLIVVNKSFAEGAKEGAKNFGSTYKGNAIVGTTEADKLRVVEDIVVAGGAIDAENVFEGNVIPAGMSVEEILRKLLCVEKWPTTTSTLGSIKASVASPSITANVANKSIVEYGSSVTFNAITAKTASITGSNSIVSGFTHGYSGTLNKEDINTATSIVSVISDKVIGDSTLSASVSGFSALTTTTGSTLPSQTVTCDAVGTNKLTVNTTTGECSANIPEIPSYYIVSNMGNVDEEHESDALAEVTFAVASVTSSVTYSLTAVYPVYNNINGDSLSAEATKALTLADTDTFDISFPAEAANGYMFAYPGNRTVTAQMKDLSGNFGPYVGNFTDTNEAVKRTINGKEVQYKLWTTGNAGLGANVFRFILSKKTSVA